jgi:hypothetical protein
MVKYFFLSLFLICHMSKLVFCQFGKLAILGVSITNKGHGN